jgi:uncharacterized protein DUF4388
MLEGEIRDIDLVARLVELWREQFTGAIRFENDGIIKIIYFKSGDVLSASTNDRADSVDEILMKAGKVSRDHVKQALAKRKESETLGDTLLNLGFITRKELTWARRVQVVGVIRSISEWQSGSYTIVENYLPKRDEGTIFPLPQIIVELVVTDQDRSKYERALDSGSAIFDKSPEFEDMFGKLGFNEEAEAVTSQVDGLRTASEVAAASHQDEFNAYKLLHALSLLGLLARVGQSQPAMVAADLGTSAAEAEQEPVSHNVGTFEGIGVADAADAWSGEMPKFDLADDTGPGQVTTPLGTPAPPVALPPEPEPAIHIPAPEAKMPAWDVSPRGATPAAAPAPEPPADAAEEPQWGFDEAQIETARKASVPVSSTPVPTPPARSRDYTSTASMARRTTVSRPLPKKKKKSHFPLIVTLMAVFIAAGVAYFGFMWWQGRNAPAPAPVVTTKPRPVVPKPVTQTAATVTETTASVAPPPMATTTTATIAPTPVTTMPVTTTTAAPAPPRPSPVATTTTAPPPVPAKPGMSDRDRYEAMAREFAASPNAKFTIQFEIVCEPSNITKALREGGTSVWFVPISLKGRSCYRVFWGRYQSRDAADRAVGEVPASLREAKPAVVTVPQP